MVLTALLISIATSSAVFGIGVAPVYWISARHLGDKADARRFTIIWFSACASASAVGMTVGMMIGYPI